MLSDFSAGMLKNFIKYGLADMGRGTNKPKPTPLSQILKALAPYQDVVMPRSMEDEGSITALLKQQQHQELRLLKRFKKKLSNRSRRARLVARRALLLQWLPTSWKEN